MNSEKHKVVDGKVYYTNDAGNLILEENLTPSDLRSAKITSKVQDKVEVLLEKINKSNSSIIGEINSYLMDVYGTDCESFHKLGKTQISVSNLDGSVKFTVAESVSKEMDEEYYLGLMEIKSYIKDTAEGKMLLSVIDKSDPRVIINIAREKSLRCDTESDELMWRGSTNKLERGYRIKSRTVRLRVYVKGDLIYSTEISGKSGS